MRGTMTWPLGLPPMILCCGNEMMGFPCQSRTRVTLSSPIPRLVPFWISLWAALSEAPAIFNQLAFSSSLAMPSTLTILIASAPVPGITPPARTVAIDSLPLMYLSIVLNPALSAYDAGLSLDTILHSS